MRLGLIQLYEVEPPMREAHGVLADMFARLLSIGGLSAQWRIYDGFAGEMPQKLDECDGYVISGSKCAVYEDHPWLPPLFSFIQKLHAAAAPPLAGICFGHQAIAQALGGKVEKSEKGWGVGRHSWRMNGKCEWIKAPPDELRLLVSHQDQVTTMPPGAEVLAASDFCPYSVFRMGGHIFSIQGHPEFSQAFVEALLDQRTEIIPPDVWRVAKNNVNDENDSKLCAQWLAEFFTGGQKRANL